MAHGDRGREWGTTQGGLRDAGERMQGRACSWAVSEKDRRRRRQCRGEQEGLRMAGRHGAGARKARGREEEEAEKWRRPRACGPVSVVVRGRGMVQLPRARAPQRSALRFAHLAQHASQNLPHRCKDPLV